MFIHDGNQFENMMNCAGRNLFKLHKSTLQFSYILTHPISASEVNITHKHSQNISLRRHLWFPFISNENFQKIV